MAVKKERLDVLLVEKGICTSRERAKTSIMAGLVYVDGQKVDKVGEKVSVEADIVYKGEKMPYVSRGGFKLEKAMKEFNIDLKDKTLIDNGATKITVIGVQSKVSNKHSLTALSIKVTKKDGSVENVVPKKDWGSTVKVN